jgi:quinolinate synthase
MVRLRSSGRAPTAFLIATETGILHRLELKAPGKRFVPVNREAICQYMKLTTLEKLRDSLPRRRPRDRGPGRDVPPGRVWRWSA